MDPIHNFFDLEKSNKVADQQKFDIFTKFLRQFFNVTTIEKDKVYRYSTKLETTETHQYILDNWEIMCMFNCCTQYNKKIKRLVFGVLGRMIEHLNEFYQFKQPITFEKDIFIKNMNISYIKNAYTETKATMNVIIATASPKKETVLTSTDLTFHRPISTISGEKNFSEVCAQAEKNISNSIRCDSHTQFDKLKSIPTSSPFIYSQMFLKPHNDKGEFYFRYGTIDSYPQLVEIITTTNAKYRTYNELIKENQPTKLAFDLEWCDFRLTDKEYLNFPHELRVTAPQYDASKTLQEFKRSLFSVSNEIFGQTMDESNLLILNSSRIIHSDVTNRDYFKNSYHVMVINYGYLPNLHHYHKQLTQILIDQTKENPILNNRLGITASKKEKLSHIIDIGVYSKNQNFRTVLSTKPNRNSYLLPAPKDHNLPIHHFFMGWITEKDQPLSLSELPTMITKTSNNPINPTNPTNQTNQTNPNLPQLPAPPHLQEYVTKILDSYKPDRIQEYGKWFDIMCRVYSIHTGLFDVFDRWSQKAPNYDSEAIKTYWSRLYQSNYQLDSLLELASLDTIDQKLPNLNPLIQCLQKYELQLTDIGLREDNLRGFNGDDLDVLIKVIERKYHKKQTKINDHFLKSIKNAIKKILVKKVNFLSHKEYGYQWDYVYQKCPRNPLAEAEKNNYWGATHQVNFTDQYVNIDIKELIAELLTGKYDTIVIKAPCGSAKSDFLVKFLTLMITMGHLPHNFLLIEALRTLAYSLQERFTGNTKPYEWDNDDPNPNDTNLKLYTDLKTFNDILDQNINIVINSLPKLADFGKDDQLEHHLRSLVAIDEWKSFLHNLCGRTLTGRRRKVISHLEYYLKNTPYTVVMDQNIDDDCLQTLFHLRDPKKTLFYDYQIQTCCDQTVYELHDRHMTWEILDEEYLSKGKLVYICCNSKKMGLI